MRILLLIVLLTVHASAVAQCTQPVWADEFDGSSIDLKKWAYQTGNGCPDLCGWGNGELENYTTGSKNLYIRNGMLFIEAVKEANSGSSFSSGKLVTLGLESWKYGRMEARMRMPLGVGLWPAFWMLSTNNNWPMTGEIDIMEYRGDKPKQIDATLHYGSAWPNNQHDGTTYQTSVDLSTDFHTYAVEWEESAIRWYFDKLLVKSETKNPNSLNPKSTDNAWPWTTDFYIILNLAVGGGYTGTPAADAVQLSKSTFEIDYVRVYTLPCIVAGITEDFMEEDAVSVYPQPFDHSIWVELPSQASFADVQVKDVYGKTISTMTINRKTEIDLSREVQGLYLLEMTVNGKKISHKIMKQ